MFQEPNPKFLLELPFPCEPNEPLRRDEENFTRFTYVNVFISHLEWCPISLLSYDMSSLWNSPNVTQSVYISIGMDKQIVLIWIKPSNAIKNKISCKDTFPDS